MWRRHAEQMPHPVELQPSRWDADPVARAQATFAGLVGTSGVAFEVVTEQERTRFFVRSADATAMEVTLAQVRAHHPQARVHPIIPATIDNDPLRLAAGEASASVNLRQVRAATFSLAPDADLRSGRRDQHVGSTPLAGVVATAAQAAPGVRVVLQVVLGPAIEGWGIRLAAEADAMRTAARARPVYPVGVDAIPLVGLFALGALGIRAYLWYQAGQLLPLLVLGVVGMVVLPFLAAVMVRLQYRERPSSDVVRDKLRAPAVMAQVRIAALGQADPAALRAVALRVAGALRAFDHPAGNGLRPHPLRALPDRPFIPRKILQRPVILTTAELAGLWHLLDTLPDVVPARSRQLLPVRSTFTRGCRVGVACHQGRERPVHLPLPLLVRNHLIVAKTRRGKSTILLHIARFLMERLAAGHDRLVVVVIDPHQDLAEAVLGTVPDGLEDRVIYLNLADRDWPVGINLLDPDLFSDRDHTAENIVTMLHRLWPDNWGPRMEGALRASALALFEANQVRAPADRYTLLDVVPLLSSGAFRAEVLGQVHDLAVHAWWEDTYERLGRTLQQQTANPITTKIGRFLVGEASRLTLGQARSTIDPRALLRTGGALVVNAAVGRLGEGGAALLGATVLNLLALVVEEQVAVPPAQRTRVIALVDESSTLGAADYPRMLSELGKYGLSVVLVTQSLAKLDAIDRQLRPTILANVDALTVFQVSAEDARILTPELGPELAPEDLTDLDDYACYARWSTDGRRPAAFSVLVDPPPPHDQGRAERIARRSAHLHGRPRADVLAETNTVIRMRQERRPDTSGAATNAATSLPVLLTDEAGASHAIQRASQPTGWSGPVAAKPKQGRRSHARSNDQKRLFE